MQIEVRRHALEGARTVEHRGAEPERVRARADDADIAFVPVALEKRPSS